MKNSMRVTELDPIKNLVDITLKVCVKETERVGRGEGGAEIESSVYGDVEKKRIAMAYVCTWTYIIVHTNAIISLIITVVILTTKGEVAF